MAPEAITERIRRANATLGEGRLDEALEQALGCAADAPLDPASHNLLGTVHAKRNEPMLAERAFRRSAELDPSSYRPHANLAALQRAAGDLRGALDSLQRATELEPNAARLLARRGQIERDLDEPALALVSFSRAFELEPSALHGDAYGRALFEAGQIEAAVRFLEGRPPSRTARIVLAHAYDALDRVPELQAVLEALAREPVPVSIGSAMLKLAKQNGLFALGRAMAAAMVAGAGADETAAEQATLALAAYEELCGEYTTALKVLEERAVRFPTERIIAEWVYACMRVRPNRIPDSLLDLANEKHPRSVRVLAALGALHADLDRQDAGVEACERALAIDPDCAPALNQLAISYGDMGFAVRARDLSRRAVSLAPFDVGKAAASEFYRLHDDAESPEEVARSITAWADRYMVAVRTVAQRPRSLDPERKLNVAYLSGDFRDHPVMKFMLPLLRAHDREGYEVYCYSNSARADRVTEVVRALDVRYKNVRGLHPKVVANRMAEDGIDIAIDLGGLTADSLVTAFAYRPAPIQASYLGWPATTGMLDIDLRITDVWADPPGRTEHLHTESLARLPVAGWCYEGDDDLDLVERPPDGPLIFGSFNRAAKLSTPLLRTWARILRELPEARLLLKGKTLYTQSARRRVLDLMLEEGIQEDRLLLMGWTRSGAHHHMRSWGDVDIALDSFPYAGTTTTCEALWMGVPVVTHAGASHVSRVGASLLTAVGLSDLVASDWDGYVERAIALARDQPRRQDLRRTLRDTFRASSLGSRGPFTRAFEALLRDAWRRHVASPRATSPSDTRLTGVAPRHFVPASILDRGAFIAMEQGAERDAETTFARTFLDARASTRPARVVLDSAAPFAHALTLASRSPALSVVFHASAPDPIAAHRTTTELAALPNLALVERPLRSDDLLGADLVETHARTFFEAWDTAAPHERPAFARLHIERDKDSVFALARAREFMVLRALPGLDVVVQVEAPAGVDGLGRSLFVAQPPALEALLRSNLCVTTIPSPPSDPSFDACSKDLRHLHAFGFSDHPLPRSVALYLASQRPETSLAERVALLLQAFEQSEADLVDDDVGGRMTRARLAYAVGRRSIIPGVLAPLLSGGEPRRPFLCPVPEREPPRSREDAFHWFELRALEALVLFGARTSYDHPVIHAQLLDRYLRRGGEDREMNRRYGLVLAMDRLAT